MIEGVTMLGDDRIQVRARPRYKVIVDPYRTPAFKVIDLISGVEWMCTVRDFGEQIRVFRTVDGEVRSILIDRTDVITDVDLSGHDEWAARP